MSFPGFQGRPGPCCPVGGATWVRGTWRPSAGCGSLGRQLPGVALWVLGPHRSADAPLEVPTFATLHSPAWAVTGLRLHVRGSWRRPLALQVDGVAVLLFAQAPACGLPSSGLVSC